MVKFWKKFVAWWIGPEPEDAPLSKLDRMDGLR